MVASMKAMVLASAFLLASRVISGFAPMKL